MSTHNIPKRKNHPKLSQICTYGIFSQGLKHEFEIAIDDSERAISVRATEILLYVFPYKLAEADKKINYGSVHVCFRFQWVYGIANKTRAINSL